MDDHSLLRQGISALLKDESNPTRERWCSPTASDRHDGAKRVIIELCSLEMALRNTLSGLRLVLGDRNLTGMRRLFSRFEDGLPSLGLLLLRVVSGVTLILRFVQLHNRASVQTTAPYVIAAGIGLLLLFGSWTAVAGVMVAIIESMIAFSHNGDPWVSVLLASLGICLALLGPGDWSVDARRSGWKRIEIRRPNE